MSSHMWRKTFSFYMVSLKIGAKIKGNYNVSYGYRNALKFMSENFITLYRPWIFLEF